MKNTLLLFCIIIGISVHSQTSTKLYNSKSGKISYKYEVEDVISTFTLIYDNYGSKQAYEWVTNVEGYSQKTRTISTPTAIYIINYDDNQAIKFPAESDDESMEMYGGNPMDVNGLVFEVNKNESSKKGTATILGKTCDYYEFTDAGGGFGKYWLYNGILLKAEFIEDQGMHAYMEATDLKIDVPINATEFLVPAGFSEVDMTQTMEQMKKMQEMYGVPDEE